MNQSEDRPLEWQSGKRLLIDQEGTWHYGESPLQHAATLKLLASCLTRDESGHYGIDWEGRQMALDVEDTPFVVVGLTGDWPGGAPVLKLNDGSEALLDPDTLWLRDETSLLCRVGKQQWPARFSRPAFASLMSQAVLSPDGESWSLLGHALRREDRAAVTK